MEFLDHIVYLQQNITKPNLYRIGQDQCFAGFVNDAVQLAQCPCNIRHVISVDRYMLNLNYCDKKCPKTTWSNLSDRYMEARIKVLTKIRKKNVANQYLST